MGRHDIYTFVSCPLYSLLFSIFAHGANATTTQLAIHTTQN
jgi:hypothetical protein